MGGESDTRLAKSSEAIASELKREWTCNALQGHLIKMNPPLLAKSVKTGEKSGPFRDKRLENLRAGLDAAIKANQAQSNLIAVKKAEMEEGFGAWVRRLENAFLSPWKRDNKLRAGRGTLPLAMRDTPLRAHTL